MNSVIEGPVAAIDAAQREASQQVGQTNAILTPAKDDSKITHEEILKHCDDLIREINDENFTKMKCSSECTGSELCRARAARVLAEPENPPSVADKVGDIHV
jgi:hypothetical protein